MALLTTTRGTGMVIENVFENRYMHVDELNRMGANIQIEGRVAIVEGDRRLHGAEVFATDLRAGAALVLAALSASGTTSISEIHHIERGYSSFTDKMNALGADMTRAEE
jgi:UDP-N-acetylglucosamine 1-carboxyvinyltransferase